MEAFWAMRVDPSIQARRPEPLESSAMSTLTPTLFHQEWWLEIASGGAFGIAEVRVSGRTVGRLPYALRRRLGFKTIYMPPITHVLGPAVEEGAGGANTRFLNRLMVTRELIRMLPTMVVRQKLHREMPDTLAFQAEGFKTTVLFTHEIAPAAHEELWKNMRDKTRNVIRRAQESLTVVPLDDVDAFLHFYHQNVISKGRSNLIDRATCRALIAACQQRGCGQILSARGADGALEAAIFIAWDAKIVHYLMSSRARSSHNGAVSLLLWEAMKKASSLGLIFDFDGVANEGAILFYSGFGVKIRPCYNVERGYPTFRVLQEAYRLTLNRSSAFG
jgi:Acetyltransferase (GNAT) domain